MASMMGDRRRKGLDLRVSQQHRETVFPDVLLDLDPASLRVEAAPLAGDTLVRAVAARPSVKLDGEANGRVPVFLWRQGS